MFIFIFVLTAAAAGLLSGYFLCELDGKLFDAGFLADRRQFRVFALEDEVAERVGHVVLFAARASCFVRVAGKLSKEFLRCNERVRLLPRDEAALPGLDFKLISGQRIIAEFALFDL